MFSNVMDNKHCAILYLYIDENCTDLQNEYTTQIDSHNTQMISDSFPNSGFDIYVPYNTIFEGSHTTFVDSRVKAEMRIYDIPTSRWKTTGFYIYPRSSISKTPLMLANHTGIIDSGYRGCLIGAFRNLDTNEYYVQAMTRLLQICAPDLRPILVQTVSPGFFEETTRGEGGFGSTS
jgi:dUTP pyrophosphatase